MNVVFWKFVASSWLQIDNNRQINDVVSNAVFHNYFDDNDFLDDEYDELD